MPSGGDASLPEDPRVETRTTLLFQGGKSALKDKVGGRGTEGTHQQRQISQRLHRA